MPRWWRRKDRERDLERELQSDLELEASERQERGVSPDEARRAARCALGNTTLLKEDVRAAWGWLFLDRLKQDLTYALRGMRKSPGFAATAVLSLALGIGANTAIFSLIDALLLRRLPVRDPQGLAQVIIQRPGAEPLESFSYPLVNALADDHEIFSSLCGFSAARFAVRERDTVESTAGAWVTGGYYATLGLQPAAGRLLVESDDRAGAPPVAVITDGYWQRKFGRSADAIGRELLIEGRPVTIVGVSPSGFTGANVGETADITMPVGVMSQVRSDWESYRDAGSRWLRVLARPQPGASREQAKARLAVIWHSLTGLIISPGMPADVRRRMERSTPDVIAGGTGYTYLRQQFRRPLLVLMAVVCVLLLIACANVANLLLARASARQREIAVRLAIGASRARIIRQLLTEGLLLSLFGAAGGILLAWAGSRVLVNLLASGQVRGIVLDVSPDWLVLAFTAATACATGILFGLAPAFRGTAAGPIGALREKIAIARSRLAPLLVTAQVSLALLLLIAGGLFVRTLQNLYRLDTGFRSDGVLLASADGAREGYRGAAAAAFYESLLQQIEQLPGVQSASYALITPLAGGGISFDIELNGRPVSEQQTHFNVISRRYFETLGTTVLLGREFTSRDMAGAPRVAVVNQAFARRYLPPGNELGQRLTVNFRPEEFSVVGVVKDAVYETLRAAAPPTVYVPTVQRGGPATASFGVMFEVHAAGSLAQTAEALRATLQTKLPGSAVEVRALTQQVERALVQERLMATLAAGFGILGLVLAAVGLYGLLTYTVTRRTNEIGIRLALGAMRREVLWMVIRDVLMLLSTGVAIGVPLAWAAARFVSSMLFGLQATDLWTIGAATVVLIAAGLAAGFLPAWRASRVDPMAALRYE
jgi:predicted permease